MKFLIQQNLMNKEQLVNVKEAVQSYPHQFIELIPFSREITSNEELIGTDYIPYGSTLLTTLALDKKWKGLYFDLENFNMRSAFRERSDMLNDGLVISVYEAEKYLRLQDRDIFVRPDLDLKHFSGQVMNSIECADWFKDAMLFLPESGTYAMSPEMLVIIAEPKNILAEWRWFIVNGEIIDGSMYQNRCQLVKVHETDKHVIKEAQKFADGWLPNMNCVMDLALTEHGLKVIEFNCINSSGFYNHDVNKIFKSLWEYYVKTN